MNSADGTAPARQPLTNSINRRRLLQATLVSGGGTALTLNTAAASGTGVDRQPTVVAQASAPDGVVIAQGVDIRTFDPHEDTSSAAIAVFDNVFENLTALDDDMNLIPWLAESWENIDELTWEFKIRQGVVFHDGTPLTAEDFKFSFEHVLDPATNSRRQTQVSLIETVEAPDEFTLRLITAEPAAALLSKLQSIYALPAATYQEMGAEQFALHPVGTGPYRFVEWVRDGHVRLERYEDYWQAPAALATAEFRPIPEAATRVAALQAGELDVATLIPTIDVPVIQANPDLSIRQVPSLRVIFCGMNTFAEPFTDVRVRQALNYAVDVPSIINNLLGGFGTPLASVSGPAEFGFNPDLAPYAYDPERALQLLTEAGLPNGFSTTLDTPIGRYLQDVEVSQAIAGQLAEVGVQVEVRQAEFNEYFDRWLAEDIQGLYFLGNGATTLDADGVMDGHFDSQRRGLYYNSPESDEMIHAALQEFDPVQREALYHELMTYLHDQAPWIFLYVQEDIYGTAASLTWAPRPDESLHVSSMSRP